jgi:glycosyltransferase involved in cell wall biosynthesis
MLPALSEWLQKRSSSAGSVALHWRGLDAPRPATALALASPREAPPTMTVVVPMYNAARHITRCLDALGRSSVRPLEVIVVDDGSTDDCARLCEGYDVVLLRMPRQSGPAAARNLGVRHARGEVVLFVDSDVEVAPDTLASISTVMTNEPGLAGVFGSYDDSPAEENFFSQFKNLHHHYVHQAAPRDAVTFWAGCGAVRVDAIRSVGGFDPTQYRTPSIEDIELGYRMRASGHRIRLDRDIQVKHLKRWTLVSWLRADIFRRAVPWSLLILQTRTIVDSLNTSIAERARAVLAILFAALLVLSPFVHGALALAVAAAVANVAVNGRILRFLVGRRGVAFAVPAFFALLLYYVYSSATFAACCCVWPAVRRRVAVASPVQPLADEA